MKIIRDIREYISERPTSLTIGKFDGLHLGHRELIRKTAEAAAEQDLVPALLAFDAGKEELLTVSEREEELAELGVGLLIECPFTEMLRNMSAEDFIHEILVKRLQARALFVGEDFRFGFKRTGDARMLAEFASSCGFSVEVIPDVVIDGVRVSSTEIRERLAAGDMEAVERLLGHPYYLTAAGRTAVKNLPERSCGTLALEAADTDHGRETRAVVSAVGRDPDGPTAVNLRFRPDQRKLLPPYGTYDCVCRRVFSGKLPEEADSKVDVLHRV